MIYNENWSVEQHIEVLQYELKRIHMSRSVVKASTELADRIQEFHRLDRLDYIEEYLADRIKEFKEEASSINAMKEAMYEKS